MHGWSLGLSYNHTVTEDIDLKFIFANYFLTQEYQFRNTGGFSETQEFTAKSKNNFVPSLGIEGVFNLTENFNFFFGIKYLATSNIKDAKISSNDPNVKIKGQDSIYMDIGVGFKF